MFSNRVLITNIIAFIVLAALMSALFGAGVGAGGAGAAGCLLGAINVCVGIVSFAVKRPVAGRTLLLSAGILLLVGFSLCSLSPIKL